MTAKFRVYLEVTERESAVVTSAADAVVEAPDPATAGLVEAVCAGDLGDTSPEDLVAYEWQVVSRAQVESQIVTGPAGRDARRAKSSDVIDVDHARVTELMAELDDQEKEDP